MPSLAGAAWLSATPVQRVFAALGGGGEEIRIVGGAVRDSLAGRPVGDIDFATTALPGEVTARAARAGIKAVPTGIEHGTVTLIADGVPFQMTTLREDVETDGRRAVVRFGRDWTADARRRDFTINALSLDADGTVHDPLGGFADIVARRIRFIGDPDRRIAEDRLRILRFFRFNAEFGDGALDAPGLGAAIRARDGLRTLSAERVGQEMRRIVLAPHAAEMLGLMQDCGVLPVILAGVACLGPFSRYLDFERSVDARPSVALRLTAAVCRVAEDVERIADRLRLSNAERDLAAAALAAMPEVPNPGDDRAARHFLYALGEDGEAVFRGAVGLAYAWSEAADPARHAELYRLPDRQPRPAFPLRGRDILGAGAPHGPAVGQLLQALEAWWVDHDFVPDETELRARLQQMMASAQ
ncbi:MAG: CCA tRNA nucleotidyltransferase [Bauldia sp.]|nr:CCA tRNA nucleotidyltransferase [Bauldia sp.]